MWRLISTWQRVDGSATVMYVGQAGDPAWRLRVRRLARPIGRVRRHVRVWRRDRRRRRAEPIGDRIVTALGPVAGRHRMGTPRTDRTSAMWCTPAAELGVVDQTETVVGGEPLCTDLNVDVDQRHRTITVDLEGHGLAEFVSGRSHWDGPIAVDLADDLDRSLALVAEHLDRMCDAVIVRDDP